MSNSILRQLFCPLGFFPAKTTKCIELSRLVESLRIRPTGHNLIRVGPSGDGGYLLPDDLDGLNYCLSPGVAACSDFEDEMASRGMQVFLADKSVDGPAVKNESFRFIKKFISSQNSEKEGLITMDRWVVEQLPELANDPRCEAVLQMDIEGFEYEVLHNISDDLLKRFRIVVIEFHKLHQLADRFSFSLIAPALRKLLKSHSVVHIHPNNNRRVLKIYGLEIPATMEFTFLRKDRLIPGGQASSYPHPLDVKCVSNKRDVVLPLCWQPQV
ncbi:FkbM family methyltransferase [Opitutales bacterium]|nr:FkbM family methyltransferase [Opitutales bacterium]